MEFELLVIWTQLHSKREPQCIDRRFIWSIDLFHIPPQRHSDRWIFHCATDWHWILQATERRVADRGLMRLSFHEAMPKHRRPPPAQGAKDRDLIKWPSMVVTPALVLICAWLCYVVVQTKRSHCDCDEKTDAGKEASAEATTHTKVTAGALRHQVKRMKWRPMTPAKIDDQVDDTGFPYR